MYTRLDWTEFWLAWRLLRMVIPISVQFLLQLPNFRLGHLSEWTWRILVAYFFSLVWNQKNVPILFGEHPHLHRTVTEWRPAGLLVCFGWRWYFKGKVPRARWCLELVNLWLLTANIADETNLPVTTSSTTPTFQMIWVSIGNTQKRSHRTGYGEVSRQEVGGVRGGLFID